MAFEVNTYDPSSVILAFGGYPLTGWNSISIRKNSPGYVIDRGIRGKHTRHRNTDTSATITFSCIQTGEANDILSDIHRVDLQTGLGRIDLTLKDLSGSSLFHSSEAFIADFPESRYSADFEYRIWTIVCLTTDADWNVGGNLQPQASLYTQLSNYVGDALQNLI